jgi:phage-related protein
MAISADVQRLELGQRIELFALDATALSGDVLRFHGLTQSSSIWWQGKEFKAWPIEASGFERTGDGQQPAPTLSVGNIDGSISALCIYLQDLVGATLYRYRTLGKYLDARNFPWDEPYPETITMSADFVADRYEIANGVSDGRSLSLNFVFGEYAVFNGNPTADPNEHYPTETWLIERKADADSEIVTFELSSVLDFSEERLPRRQIIAGVCTWLMIGGYRGPYCGYNGSAYFDKDDNPVSDPTLDRCAGRTRSCKCRFGENNPLPYGSFPAADLVRA